ncbi:hypothetical protein CDAR_505061 [Caerostris darwini]|uniref:Uncharacterized protein n=1 Tax=Caerostris darwini TaxID=1538125 RepID=A0AAV4MGI2_9ARAC|nr:hypothetical protein CDAR_505061 [Caerostris darwini]
MLWSTSRNKLHGTFEHSLNCDEIHAENWRSCTVVASLLFLPKLRKKILRKQVTIPSWPLFQSLSFTLSQSNPTNINSYSSHYAFLTACGQEQNDGQWQQKRSAQDGVEFAQFASWCRSS